MKLKDFIQQFVCKNTIVRLWTPLKGGHYLLAKSENDVCMEWQIQNDGVWQSEYANHEVVGVTDIVVDTYKEAVNIVIKAEILDGEW